MRSASTTTRKPPNESGPRWPVRKIKASPGISSGAGRGLFAAARIADGEIIERACTAEIDAEQSLKLDEMRPLGDYYFEHPKDKARGLMVFGLPSLCNHRDRPNADVRFIWEDGIGWVAELFALAQIPRGDEITYRYKMIWFERKD